VRLLLDTHVALWAISGDRRLSKRARAAILDPGAEVFVSAVSLWEIAIKHALGRTGPNAMPVSASQASIWFAESGFGELAVTGAHAVAVERLPPLHSDPFDRLLVAQAIAEPMRLLTHDATLARYSELVVAD
jgi:PIN domain nuclease of toxin-antitoxin system